MADDPGAADLLAKLHVDSRIPPAELIGKVDKGYAKLDYVGHAAVTDILLAHDPLWDWEPVAWTDRGMPAVVLDKEGWPVGMWIRLTVHGHSRLGYGTCPPGKADAIKELIGDALRNAAMRFGVALSLWAKEEWSDLGVGQAPRAEERSQQTSGEVQTENVPRPGSNVQSLPLPSDGDVARHPSASGRRRKASSGEPVLAPAQALAKMAADLGIDDDTRRDIIQAIGAKRNPPADPPIRSGKDLLEGVEIRWCADAFEDIARGDVELRYDPDGNPRLVRVRRPVAGNNPGPPDEPF